MKSRTRPPGPATVFFQISRNFWCTFGANSAKSAPVTGALSVHFWCKQRQKCTSQWCTFGALSVHFEPTDALSVHFWCSLAIAGALLVLTAPKVHQHRCTFGANSAKSAPVTGALLVHFWCKQRQKCTSHWCTFGAKSAKSAPKVRQSKTAFGNTPEIFPENFKIFPKIFKNL